MTDDGDFRCGFIAVVGRPNVGKSTLVNTILGRKISIVTPKPQTTRHRIVGVHTLSHAQLLFVDTPGLHDGTGRALNRMMNRAASDAVTDADVNLFVCEAERFTDADAAVVERLGEARGAVIAVLNKVDRVTPKEALLERIAAVAAHRDFAEILPLSARRREDVDRLVALLPGYLPRSPALFPESTVSDRGDAFRAAELVREKLTLLTHQELPYGLTVQTERYERDAGGLSFSAVIWVERESQKGMVVGRGGGLLKKAGRQVRLELKADLGMPVHVDLWVKVRDNWADSDRDLEQLGYDV